MKAIDQVYLSLRKQLIGGGWIILTDGGFQLTVRRDEVVVNLLNQGHGAIDWTGFIYEPEDLKDYDPLAGYTGEPATPITVFKIEGTIDNCRIQQTIADATAPKIGPSGVPFGYRKEEVFAGHLDDGFRELLDRTHRKIQHVLRPAAQA